MEFSFFSHYSLAVCVKPDFGDLAESSDSSSMEDSEIAKNAAAIHAIEKEEEDLARFGHLKGAVSFFYSSRKYP